MLFELSPSERLFHQQVSTLCAELVAPRARERDVAGTFPSDILPYLTEMGLLGVNVPQAYGGSARGSVAYALAIRELASADASVAVTVAVTNMVAEILCRFGSEDQKQKFVVPLVSGKLGVGSFALSESNSGSDAASLRTQAALTDGCYVLTGSKSWITSGDRAGVIIVYARTSMAHKQRGISAFIVEPGFTGFASGKSEHKLGLRGSSTVSLTFDECRVPVTNLIGHEGMGFTIAMTALDGGRIGIAAQAIGIASSAFNEAVRIVSGPGGGKAALSETYSVQNVIANIATELDAAWLLTLRAARSKDSGEPFTREAAMAKLYSTEAANRVCEAALRLGGSQALVADSALSRALRDVRVTTIYEGTSEVQRIVIARECFRNR
ncbi:MAG: acyl-CoA dehydrogenase family protein [Myxococcales bacterium]|nr:acyl-CoA dehydrogenase family protein [Myxococcales bacterium]